MSKRPAPGEPQPPRESHHSSGATLTIVVAVIGVVGAIVAALLTNQDVNVFVNDGSDDSSGFPPQTVTSPPSSTAGEAVLYTADWTDGPEAWDMPVGWQVIDGMLVNDGTDSSWLYAPFTPTVTNYAVEAEIRYVNQGMSPCGYFALGARHDGSGGYWGGVGFGSDPRACEDVADLAMIWPGRPGIDFQSTGFYSFVSAEFDPGSGWHDYRLEVEGNTVRLLIDGDLIVKVEDNLHLTPGRVGLICAFLQISVRSFSVFPL